MSIFFFLLINSYWMSRFQNIVILMKYDGWDLNRKHYKRYRYFYFLNFRDLNVTIVFNQTTKTHSIIWRVKDAMSSTLQHVDNYKVRLLWGDVRNQMIRDWSPNKEFFFFFLDGQISNGLLSFHLPLPKIKFELPVIHYLLCQSDHALTQG